jgi:hypothetical protein
MSVKVSQVIDSTYFFLWLVVDLMDNRLTNNFDTLKLLINHVEREASRGTLFPSYFPNFTITTFSFGHTFFHLISIPRAKCNHYLSKSNTNLSHTR